MNETLKTIEERRSTRGFTAEQLTEGELQAILDAAVQSPTARNTQYWHFSAVQNVELLDAFAADLAALVRGRLPEGKRGRFDEADFHVFYHAPTVVFISLPVKNDNRFAEIDAGIAVENIALAAQSMGLGSVIIGMAKDLFLTEQGEVYRRAFGFPEGYDFAIAIVIGHNTVTKEAHPVGENKISIIR